MWMVHCICHITWSATVAVWLFVRLFAHWPASFPEMASTHNWSTSLRFHNITNGQLSIHIKIRGFMLVCVCMRGLSESCLIVCLEGFSHNDSSPPSHSSLRTYCHRQTEWQMDEEEEHCQNDSGGQIIVTQNEQNFVMVVGLSSVQNKQIITAELKRKFKHLCHMSILCL